MANKKLTPSQQQALSSRINAITGGRGQGSGNAPTRESSTSTPENKTNQSVTNATTTGTTATPVLTPPPVDWEQAAKELYGGYYAIIESVPELQDLLRKAIGPPAMSDTQFEYALRQTNWWKQNSATTREWDLGSQVDPASAEQKIVNRVSQLQNIALSEYGVQIDEAKLRKLSTDSLRYGWTEQTLMNAIGFEATRSSMGMSQLSSGFIGQNIRETANAYGLKLSDESVNRWATSIATGQETKQRFQQYALNTAKGLFPAIASQLDSGLTFQQVVDPFRNVASQILEISPQSIDFTDPKWARAISTVEQNGQQRMMSFSEWGDYLRTERSFGYEYTSDAQQKAYKVANDLANLFGRV